MNPGGTIGLDLKPEEKRFLREHREYNTAQDTGSACEPETNDK